jgi:hypothetical protein
MFNYCVWYRVKNNSINLLIKELALKFNTNIYNAHLTIEHSLELSEAITIYNKFNIKKNPRFLLIGIPYQTKKEDFYAIQQDYIEDCFINKKIYHISLAYRVGSKFTKDELEIASSLSIPKFIDKEDIGVELWNCDSKICSDWKLIKNSIQVY